MLKTSCPECGQAIPVAAPSGFCPACLLSLGLGPGVVRGPEPAPPSPLSAAPAARTGDADLEHPGLEVGRYTLRSVLGEGGFGTVWLAEQREPVRREVALKIIKRGMDTRRVVARFEAERQALALMDHPNIARVLDGGATDGGRPYFVLELVRGLPITEYCDARQLSTTDRIALFIPVCLAVQHAHQKSIIHRDLKPANILIAEEDGRAVPKVIDFGVAKAMADPLTDKTLVTHLHEFLGTPAYMSPEQAGLQGLDIDSRSDVYSLGVLLHEVLTGRPPIDPRTLSGHGIDGMLKAVRESLPSKPSTTFATLSGSERRATAARRQEEPAHLGRRLRGDLDWILLKALEKDRDRRYQTANGLAADLRRHLDHEPVDAHPPSYSYRFGQLARRHRVLVAAFGAVGLSLMLGLVATSWQALRATQNLALARRNAYAAEMTVAQQAIAENNLEGALELLDRQRPRPGERQDLRGFEWRYLWQVCQGNELSTFRDVAPTNFWECCVAFSPDGRLVAYGGGGRVRIRDTSTLQEVATLPAYVSTLSFSPTGRWLATSPPVTLWETSTWTKVRTLEQSGLPAVFSPDDRWLAAGTEDHQRLQLWDTRDWEVVASCPQSPLLDGSLREAVAFSPDGTRLVTPWMEITKNGQAGLSLWSVPRLEKLADLFPPGIPLQSAAFLPGGTRLITAGWLGDVLVWDVATLPPRLVFQSREHTTYIPALAVAGSGNTFATGSADQSICLWDASTYQRLARWRGHRREVWALAMSRDGRQVVSSSPDGSVRLWSGQPRDTGEVLDDAGVVTGFSGDGRTVVLAPSEDDYRWQLASGTNRVSIPIPKEPPIKTFFEMPYSVAGTNPLAALGRTQGRVELWDLGTRTLAAGWEAGTNHVRVVEFSPDGSQLATGDDRGAITLWETRSRTKTEAFTLPKTFVGVLAFSPDGRMLAAGSFGGTEMRIWDLGTRELRLTLPGPANKMVFAPDGASLVTCSVGANEAQIWEVPSGRRIGTLKGHVGGMTQATFSPDGRTLATGAYDGRIKLWNLATGQEVVTLPYAGMITSLRFSPEGKTLAASFWQSPGYQVRLFRAPSLAEIADLEATHPRLETTR